MLKNTGKMPERRLILAAVLCGIVILSSCSENAPEINQVFWQINKIHDTAENSYYDRLSVFLDASDEDGAEDLKSLYVINDSEELFWKISGEQWVNRQGKDENWIGTNSIVMNDLSGFPPGQYRLVLIDEAGEREETSFYISSYLHDLIPSEFPSAYVKNSSLEYSSKTEYVWFYGKDGTVISEVEVAGNEWKTIMFPDNAEKAFLYSYDRLNGYGLVSGPYSPDVP